MSLAVSDSTDTTGPEIVFAGTEPSAIFASDDACKAWHQLPTFLNLPSAAEWSFPPRPETHHVRYILPDPHIRSRLHVAIEAGALLRSEDGGKTWRDRISGAQETRNPRGPPQGTRAALFGCG
jgi:hypothetical protein